jgi:hypothetical protein
LKEKSINNVKIHLQVGFWRGGGGGGMDWIDLAQVMERWQTLVTAVLNFWVPQNVGNFLTSRGPVSLSVRIVLQEVPQFH